MKNTIKTIFVIISLILISLPVIFFNAKKTVSEKENRTLAERPKLIKDERFNYSLFSEYDSYLLDHLGFRTQLINLSQKMPIKIKVSTVIDKAIVGKNGWYFYTDPNGGNNLIDFYKRNLFDDNQIQLFSDKIYDTVQWCKNNDIKCIFLIGPNKHSVYEEYYPFDRPDGITRADQMVQVFEELGVNYIFPRDYLISKKKEANFPLYYETDTHWNEYGAYLTFCLLKDKLRKLYPDINFPTIEYELSISENYTFGDLLPMLNLTSAKSTQIKLIPKKNEVLYTYIKNDFTKGIHTKGFDSKLPRALVYRDSFFNSLEPLVSPCFSEVEYHWKKISDEDKEYILSYKPDIIILESVEHSANNISNFHVSNRIMN